IPRARILGEDESPHSPNGFFSTIFERLSQSSSTSSLRYASGTPERRFLNASKISAWDTISSSEKSPCSAWSAWCTFLASSLSTIQRHLKWSSSLVRSNGSPKSKRKNTWFRTLSSFETCSKISSSATTHPSDVQTLCNSSNASWCSSNTGDFLIVCKAKFSI